MDAINSAVPVEPGSADSSLRLVRYFYADLIVGKRVALLAGPFGSECDARSALPEARRVALDTWPDAAFASFGTVGFTDNRGPGRLAIGVPTQGAAQ